MWKSITLIFGILLLCAQQGSAEYYQSTNVIESQLLIDENDILSFSFPEQIGTAMINNTNYTVVIQVPSGTNVTGLTANYTLSPQADAFVGGELQESAATPNDFTYPVIYTIEAENGDLREWTVKVSETQLSNENDIISFSFPDQIGTATINGVYHSVMIEVANGSNIAELAASYTLSSQAEAFISGTLQENGVSSNDFTNPVIYTIVAENGDLQDWTITVNASVGINTLSKNEILVSPNPTNGVLNINFTDNNIQKLTISDLTGKQVIEKTSLPKKLQIDLSAFESGTYVISIQTDSELINTQIIKR